MILLHILLGILKVVGILLLILVGFVLLGILLLLFCPVVYEGEAYKDASAYGGYLKISWLFHILSFRMFFGNQEQGNGYSVKIFGIPMEKVGKLLKGKKKEKKPTGSQELSAMEVYQQKDQQKEPEKETKAFAEEPVGKSAEESEEESLTEKFSAFFRGIRQFLEKIPGIPGKILEFFRKIWLTGKKICDKIEKIRNILESERFARLKTLFLYHGKRTVLHVRPRKVRGYLKIGTEDPCITGELLAVAGIFFPVYGEHITIEPYFEKNILEGTIFLKGRIYGGFFVHLAIKLFLDSDVRFMIKKIKQG